MTDGQKLAWDVEQLQKDVAGLKRQDDDKEVRIRSLEKFETKTVENIKEIIKLLDQLQQSDVFIRRAMTTSLIGGVVTVITGVIMWLITA